MAVLAPPKDQCMKVLRRISSKIITLLPIDELILYNTQQLVITPRCYVHIQGEVFTGQCEEGAKG